jgi:thymidine phosphorylase
LQKGNPHICDKPETLLDKKIKQIPIEAGQNGFVAEVDTKAIGDAICEIGGGRLKVEDKIDAAVGFSCEKKIGDRVKKGETLGILYCRNQKQANQISEKLQNAYKIGKEKSENLELIREIVN